MTRLALSFPLALLFAASPGAAQDFGDSLKRTVQRAAESEVRSAADRETRRVTRCVLGDERCAREAREAGEEVDDLPSPAKKGAVRAGDSVLEPVEEGDSVAFVFKTLADPFAEVERQLALLPREEIARAGWEEFGAIITVASLGEAVELANRIASEHVELAIDEPLRLLGKIRNAGAIFLGHHTPEAIGDYVGGSNHVLPTGGSAAHASGLSVQTFLRGIHIIDYDRAALEGVAGHVVALALAEDLPGHAAAITVRLPD